MVGQVIQLAPALLIVGELLLRGILALMVAVPGIILEGVEGVLRKPVATLLEQTTGEMEKGS